MMDGGMWSWFLWSTLFLIVLAAVVVASAFAIRALGSRGSATGPTRDSALDILKERYARGEIDRDEFEERRRTLE